MVNKYQLQGLYLVVDPCIPGVLEKLEQAIKGGVNIIQIWDHWLPEQQKEAFIFTVCELAHSNNIPVLINQAWEWLKNTPLDGVHFDEIPPNWEVITNEIDKLSILGLTCGNGLEKVKFADHWKFSYISFCAMFPSESVGSCEIVRPETILKAREITSMPVFVSGGIDFNNIDQVLQLGVDGVAVISGILKSPNPSAAARQYQQVLEDQCN